MKKLLLIMMAMFAFGLQNVSAQNMKIISGHPDFNIKVKRCAANGKTVVIDMVFTNRSENDVDLEIGVMYEWTKIHDDQGNEYVNGMMDETITLKIGNKKPTNYNEKFTLLSGVPTKAQWVIKGVPESCEEISRMQFNVDSEAWSLHDKSTIRNIPIFRD